MMSCIPSILQLYHCMSYRGSYAYIHVHVYMYSHVSWLSSNHIRQCKCKPNQQENSRKRIVLSCSMVSFAVSSSVCIHGIHVHTGTQCVTILSSLSLPLPPPPFLSFFLPLPPSPSLSSSPSPSLSLASLFFPPLPS